MAWRDIADSEVDPESPVTTSLAQAWRDNPIGIAQGATGAPRIDGSVGAAITDPAAFASDVVDRSAVKVGNSSSAGTITASSIITISLNDYALFPSIEADGYLDMRSDSGDGSTSSSNPKFSLVEQDSLDQSYEVAWRYIS